MPSGFVMQSPSPHIEHPLVGMSGQDVVGAVGGFGTVGFGAVGGFGAGELGAEGVGAEAGADGAVGTNAVGAAGGTIGGSGSMEGEATGGGPREVAAVGYRVGSCVCAVGVVGVFT
jgi:fibronectin-binding autotransporter adhesin